MGKRNFRPFVGGTSILTRMAACRRGGEGRTGKNWADGLREAVCLAFKEAKKERKSCLPAWRRGEVRKYYPENTIVFSG